MTEQTLQKVVSLIKEAHQIGFQALDMDEFQKGKVILNSKGFGVFCDSTGELHPRLREIGEELNKIGGIQLMQEAYYEIIKPFGSHGPNLKGAWHGVGNWLN